MRINTSTPNYGIVLPDENLCLDSETVVYAILLFVLFAGGVYWTTRNIWYAVYTMCIYILLGAFLFVVWNSVHPYLHYRNGRDITPFAFSAQTVHRFRNSWYINSMLTNHVMHHIVKGERKGNYNIVFPGADWLFGTDNTPSPEAERIVAQLHARHRSGTVDPALVRRRSLGQRPSSV